MRVAGFPQNIDHAGDSKTNPIEGMTLHVYRTLTITPLPAWYCCLECLPQHVINMYKVKVCMMHSFIIIREVLILTLSIFIALLGCISWYPLATGVILNDMIFRDHIIQYTPCSRECTLPMANIRNTSSRGKH